MAKRTVKSDNLVDWSTFGELVGEARKTAGFGNAAVYAEHLASEYNFHVSDRTIYRVERGESVPSAGLLIAMLISLPLEGRGDYLAKSLIGSAKTSEYSIVSIKKRSNNT